jgi:hypothetical protein
VIFCGCQAVVHFVDAIQRTVVETGHLVAVVSDSASVLDVPPLDAAVRVDEPVVGFADHQRLKDAVGFDGIGELQEPIGVETGAGIEGRRPHMAQRDYEGGVVN